MCLINMPAGAKAHLDCRSRSGLSRLGAAFGRFPPHNFPFPSGASAPQTLSQSGIEYFPTAFACLGNTDTHTYTHTYTHTHKHTHIQIYTYILSLVCILCPFYLFFLLRLSSFAPLSLFLPSMCWGYTFVTCIQGLFTFVLDSSSFHLSRSKLWHKPLNQTL